MSDWPRIDPDVRHVGVTYLRRLTSDRLRELSGPIVFQDGDCPLAVLVPYEVYMRMQSELQGLPS